MKSIESEVMFNFPTQSGFTTASYQNELDALLSIWRWEQRSIAFSFTNSPTDYESTYESWLPDDRKSRSGIQSLAPAQKEAVRNWMSQFGAVTNLNLVELEGESDRNATIRVARNNTPTTAYAYAPYQGFVESGDVFIGNNNAYGNPTIGSYFFYGLGHELGHALGLKHPHESTGVNNVAASSERDCMEFTVMSYKAYPDGSMVKTTNEDGSYPQSLMMDDIRALQYLYGANFDRNSSNTTYKFSLTTGEMFVNGVGQGTPDTNKVFRTIWDGNGIDTYDLADYTTNLAIDLTPGSWSDLDVGGNAQRAKLGPDNYARGHVFNAFQFNNDARSLVENANGGSGNDKISGNSASNTLNGGAGNDTIEGGAGNDRLDGGSGSDTLTGGSGNDVYIIDDAGDTVVETSTLRSEIDTIHSSVNTALVLNVENLKLEGDREIYGTGNNLNNYILGNSAANILSGGVGNDTLNGGAGNDTLIGGAGKDIFAFSQGNGIDSIRDFSAGSDRLAISSSFGGGLNIGSISASQLGVVSGGSTATSASQRFIYDLSTGGLFFDADGWGAGAAIQFATLSNRASLSAANIFID